MLSLAAQILTVGLAFAAPRVEADPNAEYPVTPEAGKWLICAASYTGPESASLARQLAYQLRARDNYPAYTFSRSEEIRRQQQDEEEQLRKAHPNLPARHRRIRIEEQWAVLVGGWPDLESASAALTKVKQLPIHDLKTSSGRIANEVLIVPAGSTEEERKKGKMQAVVLNPVINAFVIRNPTVPAESRPVQQFDPLWETINADESYSLLKNPKAWTLLIKEYHGASSLQSATVPSGSLFDKIFGRNKPGDALNAAAAQAHEVARVLRQLKFEAWVMHTRTSSFVTVGGFDSRDDPNMERLAAQIVRLKLGPVDFMAQPLPVQVPRREK